MYELVTEEKSLQDLIARLGDGDWVAVDTEFVRERTYWPKLCLVQVADRAGNPACIDTLALPSLDPLLDLLWRTDITKVFHAASQDLEVLYKLRGALPGPVFDTQVAAAMTGDDDQIGYAAAVETHTGIKLDKAHTRTDWSRRPLSESELRYAADDVRHLPALHDALTGELERLGRVDWAAQESNAITDAARFAPDPDGAWKRVKGTKRLDAAGFARLRALAAWRERAAMHTDRPRRWILADEVLVRLADRPPGNAAALAEAEGLPPAVARKHGDALLAVLDQASESPGDVLAADRALDKAQRARVNALLDEVKQVAGELGIAPAMLATRRDVESLVRGTIPPSLAGGWRLPVIGERLSKLAGAADA